MAIPSIAGDDAGDPRERIRAINTLLRCGVGTVKEIRQDDVEDCVRRTLDVIRDRTSAEQFASIIEELEPIWA